MRSREKGERKEEEGPIEEEVDRLYQGRAVDCSWKHIGQDGGL